MAASDTVRSAPVSFPPDPNPKKPRLKLPPGAWDTHFHVVGPPHLFPYAEKRWHTPPAAPIEHYLAVAEVLGLERGCTVQTSAHGLDPAITLDAIRKSEGRLCGIIRADPNLSDADVKQLHAGGVRGFRIELRQRGSAAAVQGMKVDPRQQDGSYEGERFERVVALAARAAWVIALHI
ncbi:MAG TPA: amidohydrolase family protein, partial [Beijerinckiaceae bacterium]|nr:amidohydrolase family protein [Beijerinckiaceae bacterium]